MILKTIELVGYKRFKLSGINKLSLTASAPMQLILGTNGSGKSSLLEALSPFPQPKSDFKKSGYKILEIEHNGTDYVLSATYNSSGKYSFKKNNEELNPGGTATVQKELVEKELGYNNKLHSLATGEIMFTNMSPTQRREWITYISPLDMAYAIDTYKQVKTKLRDTQGALKLNEERLAKESKRLLDANILAETKNKIDKLNKQVTFHLEQTDNDYTVTTYKQLDELSKQIIKVSTDITKTKFDITGRKEINSPEKLKSVIDSLTNSIQVKRSMVSEYEIMLDETTSILKQLEEEGAVDLNGLNRKLDTLHESLSHLPAKSDKFDLNNDDVLPVLKESRGINVILSEFASNLTGCNLSIPPRSTWAGIHNNESKLKEELLIHEIKLDDLISRETIIKESKDVTCPKCKYIWIPGASETELKDISQTISKTKKHIANLKSSIESTQKTIANINIREGELIALANLEHKYPRLRPLWQNIEINDYLIIEPSMIMKAYTNWMSFLEHSHRRQVVTQEITNVETAIARIKSIGDKADIKLFNNRKKTTHKKISLLRNQIDKLVTEHKKLSGQYAIYNKMIQSIANLAVMIDNYQKVQMATLKTKVQKFNRDSLNAAQMDISSARRTTVEAETAIGVVADLKKYIDELKEEIEDLKILERSLSPTEGIIGDSMAEFINSFIEQINGIISEVWDYDLAVVPCGIDNGDMDYKFPITIDGGEESAPDISEGSKGQKEIINFAFMLAVMMRMGLNDYPLFLDEIGSNFDDAHKKKFTHYIKWILDTHQCPQMWIISHFVSEHGGLSNVETCVLNDVNVVTPDKYNDHITLN